MVAPLEGIRVLEVANWLAAPSCAALLADMGADVIKVEPPGGDAFRYVNLRPPGFDMDMSANYPFELDNRGKRSVSVALDRPGGPETVRRLAAQADIFITNLIQRRRVNYGLTIEEIQAVNPTCIYVSLSGYGTEGPEAERAGFDYAAFWARSGIMSISGDVQSAPSICRAGQGDHTTALNLLASTMVALRLRDLTGEGQVVDVTLLGTGLWTIGTDVSRTLVATSVQPPRADRVSPSNPLVNSFQCSDDRWLLLSMPQADLYWGALCKAMGRTEWLDDPRYNSLAGRGDNSAELTQELEKIISARDRDYWAQALNEAGVLWSPVSELPELVDDETLRTLGAYETIQHPEAGSFQTLSAPFSIRGADIQVRGPAPSAGANTIDVLLQSGFSEEEVSELAVAGVFG